MRQVPKELLHIQILAIIIIPTTLIVNTPTETGTQRIGLTRITWVSEWNFYHA